MNVEKQDRICAGSVLFLYMFNSFEKPGVVGYLYIITVLKKGIYKGKNHTV